MLVRSMRLLLEPDPLSGGGSVATPVPPAPVPTPLPPIPAPVVTQDELSRLRAADAEAGRLRDAETQRLAAARQGEIDAAAKKGQWDTVLALKDADLKVSNARAEAAETRAGKFAVGSALAAAMSNHPVKIGWGEKLIRDFQGQFRHYNVGETIEVRHVVTGQTPTDWLKAEMANPMYDGIKVASTSGGAPTLDAYGRPAGQAIPDTPAGRDIAHFLERRKQEQQAGGGSFGFN